MNKQFLPQTRIRFVLQAFLSGILAVISFFWAIDTAKLAAYAVSISALISSIRGIVGLISLGNGHKR